MTFSAHAVAGGALALAMPHHPALAFVAGAASHFALDATPHWNYHPRSASIDPEGAGVGKPVVYDRDLAIDLSVIAFDGVLGLVLAFIFFATPATWFAVMCGAVGGIAPDALHLLYSRWPHEPIALINKLHCRMQWDIFEHNTIAGIFSQIAIITLVFVIAKMI